MTEQRERESERERERERDRERERERERERGSFLKEQRRYGAQSREKRYIDIGGGYRERERDRERSISSVCLRERESERERDESARSGERKEAESLPSLLLHTFRLLNLQFPSQSTPQHSSLYPHPTGMYIYIYTLVFSLSVSPSPIYCFSCVNKVYSL